MGQSPEIIQSKPEFDLVKKLPQLTPRQSKNLFSVFIATAVLGRTAVGTVGAVAIFGVGIELIDREIHLAEDRAGIIVFAGLAVFFGQAEVAGGKHKLNLAFHSDDREHADGDINIVNAYAVNKGAVKTRTDGFGNSIDAHTAVAELSATLDKLAVETDRRRDLNDDGGKSGLAVTAKLVLIEAEAVLFGIGSEYRNILFAAVKDDLFIESAKTFNLLNSTAANAGFQSYAEIIADSDLIKALIEGNRLDIDVCVDDLNAFTSYRTCFVDNLLCHIAEMHLYIFKTILVARGIKNFIYANAAKLFLFAAKPAEQAVSFIH